MKRDIDVIRAIVLAVRDADGSTEEVAGIDEKQFAFHAQLLEEAGLVTARFGRPREIMAESAIIYRLTWDGHDFADSIADDTIRNMAKEHLLGSSSAWTFDILKEIVTATIKELLNLG